MSSQKGAAVQDSWWLEVTCGVAALVHMGGRPQTHAQGFLFTWKSRNLPQWDSKQEAGVTPSSGRARGKPGPGCRGLGTLTSSAHSSFLDTCDNDFLEHGRLTSPSLIGMKESPQRLGSRAKDERKSGHLGRATCRTSFTRPGPWPETGDHVGVFQAPADDLWLTHILHWNHLLRRLLPSPLPPSTHAKSVFLS